MIKIYVFMGFIASNFRMYPATKIYNFGGWIHPKVTGYKSHENIYFDHPKSPCGSVGYICDHCEEARRSINVNYVYDKVISILSI